MSKAVAPTEIESQHVVGRVFAYEAVVENGSIRVPEGVPDGLQVIIVVPAAGSRPAPGSPAWREPFEAFEAYARSHPAPADIDALSDDELNAIVHEAREHLHAAPSRS